MDLVTSFQPAVLPESDPVTPQSTTPLFSAGTTSANAMLTAVAPTPPRKSRIVLLNTRTFFPLKPSSPLITSRHQNTCGVLPPNASNFAPQFFCSCRSITVRYASHAARALSGSSVSPARSQASKRGSSPAILEMSMPAKSMTPSFKSRSMVLSSMPIWSSGVTSAVMARFDASGMVFRQNGSSSTMDTGVGLLRPITLNCAFGRSCAAAPDAIVAPRASPISKRCNICDPPSLLRTSVRLDGPVARRDRQTSVSPVASAWQSALRRKAAVDRNGGAGDEIGGGAGEKHGNAGEILRRAPALGRRAGEHPLVETRDLAPRRFGEIGVDPPRQDRVGLDVVLGPGGGERLRHLHDAAFAGGIRGGMRHAENRQHRADIDDLAAARLDHVRIGRLRANKRGGQIGIDHPP